MAFVSLPYGIKLEFNFTKDGQLCVHVMWCAKLSPITVNPTDLAAAAAAGQAWWNALRPSISNAVVLNDIVSTDWSVADGIQNILTPVANPFGGNTINAVVENNVALAASLLTGKRGRSQRGRNFLFGFTNAQKNGQNTITATFASQIVAAYQAMKTSMNGNGLAPVVASFVTNGAPRTVGQGTAILGIGIDATTDSMRRRLPGRGR